MDKLHGRQWEEAVYEELETSRLLDDEFMTLCFENGEKYVQQVLRIILNMPRLNVTSVSTQRFYANMPKRSLRMDVVAWDADGRLMNIEIQRRNSGAGGKRARFHSGILDARFLEKNTDFDELPETYVIFITESDVWGEDRPIYRFDRMETTTHRPLNDEAHIIYVNGAYHGDDPIGRLMHDFRCTDPEDMYDPLLAERVRHFKGTKEGEIHMSENMRKFMESACREAAEEAAEATSNRIQKEFIRAMAEEKLSLDVIANICKISPKRVEEILAGA